MFERSIVVRSGQLWKLLVGFALTSAGPISVGVALKYSSEIDAGTFGPLVLGGLGASIIGMCFLALSIRCPKCGARWFWQAVSKQDSGKWLLWLMGRDRCPDCEKSKPVPGSDETN